MNVSREEALFALALEESVDRRTAFLDAMCDGDAALRQRLEALLPAQSPADNLLPTLIKADPQATKRGRAEAPDESVGQTLSRYKLLEGAGAGGCGVGVCRGSSSFTW